MARDSVLRWSGPCAALLAFLSAPLAASDVVVCRVGDGAAALGSAATPVFLERHRSDGGSAGVTALPIVASAGNQPITLGGSNTSEGALAVSINGQYVTVAGYAAAVGTGSVSSTTSAAVNRVVARIDALGTVDTSTRLDAAFSTMSVRGAVSVDGSGFWVSGNGTAANGGVWFLSVGVTGGNQILSAPANVRNVDIFSGQLFATSGSGSFTNVFTIGTGLPTTAGQAATSLPGLPTSAASPYAFVMFDRNPAVAAIDTLYVADDRAIVSGGGIQKWNFDGANWNLSTTITNGLATGVRGLTGEAVGAHIVLYATTTEASANNLVRIVDDGVTTPAATIIATAPANTAYRGVTLAWVVPAVDVIFRDGFE